MSGVSEMKAVRSLIWFALVAIAFGPGYLRLDGQEVIPAHKSNTLHLILVMEKERVRVGESPMAHLTLKNLTDHPIMVDSCNNSPTLVRIKGEHGDPPIMAEGRAAMGRLLANCTLNVAVPLEPGATTIQKFILSAYYDLHEPGKYKVYLDVPSEEGLLRTDAVSFEVIPGDTVKDKNTE